MGRRSAGLLPYRVGSDGIEFLIAHPGGPFWARKDEGAWSIVKGELGDGEDPRVTARREFREEVGIDPPLGEWTELGSVTQKGGKVVIGFGVESDLDVTHAVSNTFEMEWPPRSGRLTSFPEVDRVEWLTVAQARIRLSKAQHPFLDAVEAIVGGTGFGG